jgi:hypothetical protein
MFTIYAGNNLLYSSEYQEDEFLVLSPTCSREIGKSGSVDFILLPGHYLYNTMEKLATKVYAYMDEVEIFGGRVLNWDIDFYKQKTVHCEGRLSYLLDTLQPPRSESRTVATYFAALILEHNLQVEADKQFVIGVVTIPAAETVARITSTTYRDTREAIDSDLIEKYGGFLRTRTISGVTYIDYIDEYDLTSSQTIEFGSNLLDLSQSIAAADMFTMFLPTGDTVEGSVEGMPPLPVTIETVNDDSKLLENLAGVEKYGRIVHTENFPGVTDPAELKSKAQSYFTRFYKEPPITLNITALDLHLFNTSLDRFMVGYKMHTISSPHGINVTLTCLSIKYDLENVEKTELVIGTFSSKPAVKISSKVGKATGGGGGSGGDVGEQFKHIKQDKDNYVITAKNIGLVAEQILLESTARTAEGVDMRAAITVEANKINAEVTRASTEEGNLAGRVTIEADRITAEVTRSGLAEGDLSGRLTIEADKINAEVTRASTAEGTLSGRITVEADKITAEVTRAGTAEGVLTGKITVEKDRITSEVTRAGIAEGLLSGRITVEANRITAEVTRSTAAEGQLSGRITVEKDKIDIEVTRAVGMETSLASRITVTEGNIALTVRKGTVISEINVSTEAIKIKAAQIILTGTNGIIVQGALTVQAELSAANASIQNLISGIAHFDLIHSLGIIHADGVMYSDGLDVTGNGDISGTLWVHGAFTGLSAVLSARLTALNLTITGSATMAAISATTLALSGTATMKKITATGDINATGNITAGVGLYGDLITVTGKVTCGSLTLGAEIITKRSKTVVTDVSLDKGYDYARNASNTGTMQVLTICNIIKTTSIIYYLSDE